MIVTLQTVHVIAHTSACTRDRHTSDCTRDSHTSDCTRDSHTSDFIIAIVNLQWILLFWLTLCLLILILLNFTVQVIILFYAIHKRDKVYATVLSLNFT